MNMKRGPAGCGCKALNRRELLQVVGGSAGALLLATALPGCSSPTGSPPAGKISAMKVSDYKLDSLQVLSSDVAVGLDDKGLYAMSAVCTHAGCILDDNAKTIAAGLSCPCHGSTFDGNGQVTRGPARSPLQHYRVSVGSDGSVTVDADTPVAANVRTPTG
jgi:nitrite reductase/ring-hydroxylating ferredoxin subunit